MKISEKLALPTCHHIILTFKKNNDRGTDSEFTGKRQSPGKPADSRTTRQMSREPEPESHLPKVTLNTSASNSQSEPTGEEVGQPRNL